MARTKKKSDCARPPSIHSHLTSAQALDLFYNTTNVCGCMHLGTWRIPKHRQETYSGVGDHSVTMEKCSDWVFGVARTSEQFLQQVCLAKYPFDSFSGLLSVFRGCNDVASMRFEDPINFKCSKLGVKLIACLTVGQKPSTSARCR